MALGGGVLVALFYGSRWGHLETVNWLIRNLARLHRLRGHRAVSVRHPPRARASRPRAVLPLLRARRSRRRSRSRSWSSPPSMLSSQRIGAIIAIERQIGLRNYIEGGIPLDARADLRSAAEHLSADVAAARRRGHRAGRSRRRRGLLPAADREPEAEQGARVAASRRDRPDRGERLGGDRRVRRDRQHLDRRRRPDRARARRATSCARACARSCCSGAHGAQTDASVRPDGPENSCRETWRRRGAGAREEPRLALPSLRAEAAVGRRSPCCSG